MKILSIDYGKHKIGLASSEGPTEGSGLSLVTGLGAIRVNSLKEAVKRVSEVIEKEEVERVIIGMADSGESRKIVQRFVKETKEAKGFEGIVIETVDETLTTQRAQAQIREMGGGDEDERAAMLILENYLESNDK